MTVFPDKVMDLCIFFLQLMEEKQSAHTVINVFYALKWVHDLTGSSSPNPLDNVLIRNIVESAKRTLAKPTQHRLALPADALCKLCSKFGDSKDVIVRRDIAMCLLTFAGFLRYSEVSQLKCNDIQFQNTYVNIFIRKSKTDQYRQGHTVVISETGSVSCPVLNLRKNIKQESTYLQITYYSNQVYVWRVIQILSHRTKA